MAIDFSVYQRARSLSDFLNANQDRNMAHQLQQEQIGEAQAKASAFDLDKLGEQVLYKAASGVPLTPQEQAIGQAYDAKRNQVYTDAAGNIVSKPPAFGSLSGMMGGQGHAAPLSGRFGDPTAEWQGAVTGMGENVSPATGPIDAVGQDMLAQVPNNPKLKQDVLQKIANTKIERADKPFNQEEGQAATFYDRMKNSEQYLSDPDVIAAGTNPLQKMTGSIPLVGNALVTENFQRLDQAGRDFINATLRRESGSAINPDEFDNAKKQYLPQYGDSKAKLAMKAMNRRIVIEGMKRSAGTGYKETPTPPPAETSVIKWEDLK